MKALLPVPLSAFHSVHAASLPHGNILFSAPDSYCNPGSGSPLQHIFQRDPQEYVYEGGCYRLYADNMLLGIIKKYIADYDEELVKMSKVNEVLLHITTDLTYVSQDSLNADEDIINFQNGILKITATDTELILHSADILSTIQLPCRDWSSSDWNRKGDPQAVL